MITGNKIVWGDQAVLKTTRLVGGLEMAAGPQPVQRLPSTSDIVPISSEMLGRDYAKSSWAFVAKTHHTYLTPMNNWNAHGRLNA
jgi:hypothetical protein